MSCHTTMEDFIEVTRCDTARDFIDYLKISHERWLPNDSISSPWFFRGQRRADWHLLPRAFRNEDEEVNLWFSGLKDFYRDEVKKFLVETTIVYLQDEFQPNLDTLCELILHEFVEQLAVQEFVDLADQAGHPIPEDNRLGIGELTVRKVARDVLQTSHNTGRKYLFVPAGVESALAQHHGIPTRLLDWTFSPYSAALFAAEGAVETQDLSDECLAVWAINRKGMTEWDKIENHYEIDINLVYILQKRGKIDYLRAQGGLFICDYKANWHYLRDNSWRSLEEAIQNDCEKFSGTLLRKIIMPVREALELLRLLEAESVTRAHVMPTFDHVTDTIRMRKYIDKLLRDKKI